MKREIILCVDDEKMVLDALKMEILSKLPAPMVIETALDSEEALNIVSEAAEDGDEIILVISDQRMPGMTGEILLSEIHKNHPDTLKILLTGYADVDAIKYAINHAELYRYIQKPWDREDLLLTVLEAVKKYHTKKMLAEKTLQVMHLNEELENKVEQRTLELQRMVKELEAFSYTISHDLKSHLRSIAGYTRFILEDYSNETNEGAKKLLGNISTTCNNMFILIDKLLKYATVAHLPLDKKSINMDDTVRKVFNEINVSMGNHRAELQIEAELPDIKGDLVLMIEVLHNLFSNSIKFSNKMDKALIQVSCKMEDQFYTFQIADNGAGFDMRYAGKLFEIFQRLHSQKEFEGNGIGLATVKNIIDRHGGKIWIEGKKGVGTTVYFSLPRE